MTSKHFFSLTSLLLLINLATTHSQTIEDALRYIENKSSVSPRFAALGEAFFGFSDDGSCLTINPAGLTLVPDAELSIGIN